MKKLFIYIPTYNRPEAIQMQLRALAPQVAKYPSEVRVMVNDNASTKYSYDEMVKDYIQYENIHFHRNGGNIGGNANIALGFAAITAWCLLLLPICHLLWRAGLRRYSAMGA